MRSLFCAILFVISIAPHARADSGCAVLLGNSPSSRSALTSDQALQAYFSDLLQETVLGTEELIAYKKNLEEGKILNPITEMVALMKDGAWVHQDSLQRHIDGGGLSVRAQLAWANKKLEEREYNKERQRITERDTRQTVLPEAYPFVKMIPIKGGNFTMGSPKSEANRHRDENQVEVELSSFEIMDAPVTQELWVEVMGENPSRFQKREHCQGNHRTMGSIKLCPDLPVEMVSWDDVQIFLQRLNQKLGITEGEKYRLPTEAEWEYAARAGTSSAYFFGDDPSDLEKFAVYDGDSGGQTSPVRSKLPNPWGLHDMYGNVYEWTQDWYGEKLIGGKDPVRNSSGTNRVLRGGGWNFNASYMLSAYRGYNSPSLRAYSYGFRLVRGDRPETSEGGL